MLEIFILEILISKIFMLEVFILDILVMEEDNIYKKIILVEQYIIGK